MSAVKSSDPVPNIGRTSQVKTEQLFITPEMAKQFLETNTLPNQRPLDSRHVNFLSRMMATGQWEEGRQITFAVCEGKNYLVDGQHRLNAVKMAGIPQWFVVTYRQCVDLRAVTDLYVTFDRHGKVRSLQNVIVALNLPGRLNLPPYYLSKLVSAVVLIDSGFNFNRRRLSDSEIMSGLDSWAAEAEAYFEISKKGNRRVYDGLRRQSVMAVGLVTLRHQEQAAVKFWNHVAGDEGLSRNHPAKHLNTFLVENQEKSSAVRGASLKPAIYFTKYASKCWQTYQEGREEIRRILVTDNTPIVGTPYTIN